MVGTVGICQVMWFVMLESAKDRVIGVDTPGWDGFGLAYVEPYDL
jgi:hypothetical protein